MPVPPPAQSQQVLSAVDAKLHYEELRKFHERVIFVIGGMFAVAGCLFFSNFKDAQNASEAAIARIEKSATAQIEATKADALRAVDAEVKRRIDEAFKQTNIQSLIDSAARKEVGAGINRLVGEETDRQVAKLREDMTAVSRVFGMAAQMRSGRWAAGRELIAAAATEPNELGRRVADEQLAQISRAFDVGGDSWPSDEAMRNEYFRNIANLPKTASDQEVRVAYVKKFLDPWAQTAEITAVYTALRKITGRQIRMFDIEAVKIWARESAVPEELVKQL